MKRDMELICSMLLKSEIKDRVHALYPPSSRMAGLRQTGGLTKDKIKTVEGQTK